MKRILIILLVAFAFTTCAQTVPFPPSGSVNNGSTNYRAPNKMLYFGTNPLGYLSVYPAYKIDSLFATLPIFDASLYYTKVASDARFYPLSTNPAGYLTSFTEVDPTVPAYAKTLSAFSVIKTSTDALYPTQTGGNASGTWNINVLGNAETVTNGVYSTGSYANPSWITSLAYSKLTGAPDLSGYELLANKQNSLTTDGTGVKYPTVDAINASVNTFSVADIPALEAYSGNASTVFVKDQYRGGMFYYTPTGTDNDGTIFPATGKGSGHWTRKYEGGLRVDWFGAKAGDAIDDTEAIQQTLNSANDGDNIFFTSTPFENAGYIISTTVEVNKPSVNLKSDGFVQSGIANLKGTGTGFTMFEVNNYGVGFYGLSIEGNGGVGFSPVATISGIIVNGEPVGSNGDIYVSNCTFYLLNVCIETHSRNINITDNLISNSNIGLYVGSISVGENRGFFFNRNRIHTMKDYVVLNNVANTFSYEVNDNYYDGSGTANFVYLDGVSDINIKNNIGARNRKGFITLLNSSAYSITDNSIFSHLSVPADTLATINLDNSSYGVVQGNMLKNSPYTAILSVGSSENNISNNTIIDWAYITAISGSGVTSGSGKYGLKIDAASLKNTVSNNSFRISSSSITHDVNVSNDNDNNAIVNNDYHSYTASSTAYPSYHNNDVRTTKDVYALGVNATYGRFSGTDSTALISLNLEGVNSFNFRPITDSPSEASLEIGTAIAEDLFGTITQRWYGNGNLDYFGNINNTGSYTGAKPLSIFSNITGDTGANLYNANATGFGVDIRGGNSTNYALSVKNYNGSITALTALGNGNVLVASTVDNGEALQVEGKATVATAPTNPTDVVRLTDLGSYATTASLSNYVNTTGNQTSILGTKAWTNRHTFNDGLDIVNDGMSIDPQASGIVPISIQGSLAGTNKYLGITAMGLSFMTNTSNGFILGISPTTLTASRNISFPDADGTVALTSSLPIAGSFSGVGTATTTFTVTIGATQANTTYKVTATPSNVLSAAVFYINNKTTTSFDVVYLAGLTGSVAFDWILAK